MIHSFWNKQKGRERTETGFLTGLYSVYQLGPMLYGSSFCQEFSIIKSFLVVVSIIKCLSQQRAFWNNTESLLEGQ